MPSDNFFHRPDLASRLANQILHTSATSATSSGLFLSAPRRTGKSTFLREDLRPMLQSRGAHVLYADLWENKSVDPGDVIVSTIRSELRQHDGVVTRLARSVGVDKVKVGGLSFDLDRVGLGRDISLSEALSALSDETGKPIVLIIDEAQHAITSDAGSNALFALKAARDKINSSGQVGLRIVATGSSQAKLAMLRNSKDQAFFLAPLVNFPPLGRQYVEWFVERVNLLAHLDADAVWPLFERAGFRPEILGAAADSLRFDFELSPSDVSSRFNEQVAKELDTSDSATLQVVHSLTPLQSSVLRVLAIAGDDFAPFEAQTLRMYQQALEKISPKGTLIADVPNVQQALQALQLLALVWRAARGVYALEDPGLATLMAARGMLDLTEAQAACREPDADSSPGPDIA